MPSVFELLRNTPWYVVVLIALLLIPAGSFTISRFGWSELAARYRCEPPVGDMRVRIISAVIGSATYNHCLRLKCDSTGFYLRPLAIFSLFHPAVYIPWDDVSSVSDAKSLLGPQKVLWAGRPVPVKIQISQSTFSRIAQYLPQAS